MGAPAMAESGRQTGQAPAHPLLAPLYRGPLADLEPPRAPAAAAIPLSRLEDPEWLRPAIAAFATAHGHDDELAAASQWSKHYMAAAVVPAVVANLLLARDIATPGTGSAGALLTDDNRVFAITLADDLAPVSASEAGRFAGLIDDLILPVANALAGLTGASPRVFTSNAGNVFEYITSVVADHPDAPDGAAEPAYQLMARRRQPDGRTNPLYQPVRYYTDAEGNRHRVRRLCCIRYRAANLDYCGNCPLLAENQAIQD